ncbi:type III pantothenate kinase [Marinobacter sp. M216]|uniref:Type III pantothenate kinase n=1 Tax=Marinobacter albus TaxID=3030833 RepID=A0ABT7HH20_9GAMM|nr:MULTISPECIES: type III pantothenate kinase [unclassified Marinobacter]MBW7472943.1 type III pantothenate kinase [Marinobacter sp. F4218]MDK9559665.1 type III pantothenate kinase [Marinobacter sp. M216]
MKLLIDAGNSRLKWRLDQDGRILEQGVGTLDDADPLPGLSIDARNLTGVAVSTVASEERRLNLMEQLSARTAAPIRFYWAETRRGGLVNAYADPRMMGADRWHAMYGAWRSINAGFVVVDAGSAVTVDYVAPSGQHLGGFILPGLHMMLRSLKSDAARIGFDPDQVLDTRPGKSTGECVNHGLAWLSAAVVDQIHKDAQAFGLDRIVVTGGDADRLLGLGLSAANRPQLVLDGLALIDNEDQAQ